MESNNNKSNLLKNSAIVASLILATAGVSLALVKSNDNKKLIKNNGTEKAKLVQALKDLKEENKLKSEKLKNQLESEKRALEGKLALKTTTEALNNELTNVKTELTNKDLTEAFNKLFKKTPKYIKALKAYKVSEFEKSPEYANELTAYKVSQFEKTIPYKKALETEFKKHLILDLIVNGKTYNDLTEANFQRKLKALNFQLKMLANQKNKKVNDYKNELKKEFLETLKNGNKHNQSLFNNALNFWNSNFFNKSEFIKTNEYKTPFNTFKTTKTSDQWKTAFIKTSKYTTPLSAFSVSKHEFIQTKAYKDAFSEYLFSFNEKLEAQKTQLESKINQKADITALNEKFGEYTKSTELTTNYALKSKITTEALTTLLKNVFASKALNELDQNKLNGLKNKLVEALKDKLATKTALSNQKTELKTQINTKLTTSKLLEKIKDLDFDDALKTKLTTALNEKFGEYTKSTELTTNYALKSKITTEALTTLLKNVFASKALNELDQNKLNGLKNKLVEALKDKLATKTALSEYLKQSEFINELIKVLDKTKTSANSDEVKAVILKMVEDKIIKNAFKKLVQEFKGLSDISQQTGRELHNTEKTNSFYKLAPFLFESPAQANAKLNELLEGNINDKQDKLAIWKVGDTNDWIFGTLSELKAKTKGGKGKDKNDPKYSKLQKVVYQNNGWNVEGNNNIFRQS